MYKQSHSLQDRARDGQIWLKFTQGIIDLEYEVLVEF